MCWEHKQTPENCSPSLPPHQLTPHFFISLMQSQIKLHGVLQVVQFHQKREGLFSARLSDGYFRVKVMITKEAAKQLERSQLQLFDILEGNLRNYGKGVVMIKEALKIWRYTSTVGYTKEWKLFKPNFNNLGSHTINWNLSNNSQIIKSPPPQQMGIKQAIQDTNIENNVQINLQTKLQINREEKEIISKNLIRSPLKLQFAGGQQSKKNQEKQEQVLKQQEESKLQQTQSLQLKKQTVDTIQSLTKIQDKNDYCSSTRHSKQQLNQTQKQNESPEQKKYLWLQTFLEDADDPSPSQPLATEDNENQIDNSDVDSDAFDLMLVKLREAKKQGSIVSKERGKQETYRSILDAFENQDESAEEQHVPINQEADKCKPTLKGQEIKSLVWMQRELCSIEKEKKRRLLLQQCSEEEEETKYENKIQIHQQSVSIKQQKPQLLNAQQSGGAISECSGKRIEEYFCLGSRCQNVLNFQDVVNGFATKIKAEWATIVRILAISQYSVSGCRQCVVTDLNEKMMGRGIISGGDFLEGQIYALWNPSLTEHFKGVQIKLSSSTKKEKYPERGCNRILYEKIPHYPQQIELRRPDLFCQLGSIHKLEVEESVSVYGIIKSVTIKSKLSVCQLVDVVNCTSTTFTQFQQQNSNFQSGQQFSNRAITIFDAKVNLYRSHKSLIGKPTTIVKLDWLPATTDKPAYLNWFQSDQLISQVQLSLPNHFQVQNLACANSLPIYSRFYVQNVQIISLADRCHYEACPKCLKKIIGTICFRCGPVQNHEIRKQLFVRGVLGDHSGQINFIMSENEARTYLNGELESVWQRFRCSYLLTNLKVWAIKGDNQSYNIVKISLWALCHEINRIRSVVERYERSGAISNSLRFQKQERNECRWEK